MARRDRSAAIALLANGADFDEAARQTDDCPVALANFLSLAGWSVAALREHRQALGRVPVVGTAAHRPKRRRCLCCPNSVVNIDLSDYRLCETCRRRAASAMV